MELNKIFLKIINLIYKIYDDIILVFLHGFCWGLAILKLGIGILFMELGISILLVFIVIFSIMVYDI